MSIDRILVQCDCDRQPSVFDSIVAIDSGVNHVLRYCAVTPDSVVPLVHGAMFTRGGSALASTALFIGGSDVKLAESVFERVKATFFRNVRVSVLFDPSGCNTTASAAMVAMSRHIKPLGERALVLGGTGPVGQRVARLLAIRGASVDLVSRQKSRAEMVCNSILTEIGTGNIRPVEMSFEGIAGQEFLQSVREARMIVSAGAAGVVLLNESIRKQAHNAVVMVDLNAVPPSGIEGISPLNKASSLDSAYAYGAMGVGGIKMRIHRASIERLFQSNDAVLDAEEILGIGEELEAAQNP
ncbi:MAG: NAD(P)-dependent methylenetetrahydromethanopterin dehydrogenase [Planctomycetota bacterium]|nr:methylenetetrahydromethanopterin dehydrogenase [Planctomycetia bacterium]